MGYYETPTDGLLRRSLLVVGTPPFCELAGILGGRAGSAQERHILLPARRWWGDLSVTRVRSPHHPIHETKYTPPLKL